MRPLGIDGAGHDEPVDGARHRDVVEAQALGILGDALGLAHLFPTEDGLALARGRMHDPEAEASVCEGENLVRRRRPARVSARVGDDHDLELEPLGRMDRQQPDRIGPLLLRHGLELGRADGLLVADETDEALDVRASQLLVRPCEPHQLAQVGVPPLAVPAREHREVVVVRPDDLLARALERKPRRGRDQALEALLERAEQPLVVIGQRLGKRLLDSRVERTPPGMPANQHERVVRGADERGGEHRCERDVVVAVADQLQVGEQVDHLLLAEVAAAGGAIGRQIELTQRPLVPLGVGSGREEQDDLARSSDTALDELVDAPGDRPRLAVAPGERRPAVRTLVGDEQLDGMAEHGIGKSPEAASGW